jgi:hypothetical protein
MKIAFFNSAKDLSVDLYWGGEGNTESGNDAGPVEDDFSEDSDADSINVSYGDSTDSQPSGDPEDAGDDD